MLPLSILCPVTATSMSNKEPTSPDADDLQLQDQHGGNGLDNQQLQELRDHHIGRLFLQAHRAFAKRSIAKLRARGHERLTLAHTALLPHLELEGTTVTVLAERAGMTKQSMRSARP